MAEVQKPLVPTETPAAEPAVAAPAITETPAVEPTTTEAPAATETATDAAVPAEETKAAEPAKKVAEPIHSGALGYKGPGVLKSLIFSKKYFWFGEEAVPATSLNSYLRGEKPEVSHPTVAWSSQTGKGLLYFAKHADDKKAPSGVLNLSEATDLKKEGSVEFSFKIGTHKHTFEAKQALERDGWFLALEKAVEEGKASSEGIKTSESYKEALEKLNKPTAAAAAGATTSKAEEKKSTELKPVEGEARPQSSDDEAAKKKSKSKTRSVSRGKRNSIFGSLLGKKEETEAKKEVEHAKAEPTTTDAAPSIEPAVIAPLEPVAEPVVPATTEEAKPAETTAAPVAEAAAVEPAAETAEASKPAPKANKRNSVIGNFFEKIRSPTQEKKQSELVPAVPAKDETKEPEVPAATEEAAIAPTATEAAPVTEATETPAAPAIPTEETKPAEATATTPKKDKKGFSFNSVFGTVKEKVRSPTSEKPPVIEAPKTEEAPKIEESAPKIEETPKIEEPALTTEAAAPAAAAAPLTTEATEPVKTEETAATETAAAPAEAPKEKRKSSFFGNITKKDKTPVNGEAKAEEKEKHPSKLSGLFRNPSKAIKSKKEKESTPKAEETEATKEEPITEAAAEHKEAKVEEEKKSEPATIGDVVPEAVTVGQPSTTSTSSAVPTAA